MRLYELSSIHANLTRRERNIKLSKLLSMTIGKRIFKKSCSTMY